MYKAPIFKDKTTGKQIKDAYYDQFASVYRLALQRILKNRRIWTEGIWGHKGKVVTMRLQSGTKAEAFIKHCIKSDSFFRKLLCGDLSQMSELFQVLKRWIGNDWELRKLSEQDKLQISRQQENGLDPICHFHSVVRRIFVNTLYDKELNKLWVLRRKQLKYCPYCGDDQVFVTNHVGINGKLVGSNPYIDHYLPKSVYPFFAVNFFNLFPCCRRCNSDSHKGNKIPIEYDALGNSHFLIMYPYSFNKTRLEFVYVPQSPEHLNDDIELKCLDPYLDNGYKKILGLEAHYKNYKNEAKNMIDRANDYLSQDVISYGKKTYGFDKRFLKFYVRMTLGFDPWENESYTVQRYKFKMDIFDQINRQKNIDITI